MSDALTAAAQALSAPEAIVRRSAEARAKVMGVQVDDILTAWAGGTAVAAAPVMAVPDVSTAAESAPGRTAPGV